MKNTKIKQIIPYLWILVPFILIGAIQKSAFYSDWLSEQATNNTKIESDTVIYSLSSNRYQQLNQINLSIQTDAINSPREAVEFLEEYLELAKQNANSTYAGFAISGYKLFPDEIKNSLSVQSIYADILAYIHDFDGAIDILTQLEKDKAYKQQVILKIMNIYMLKGNYGGVETQCEKTKNFIDYKVSIVCRLWLSGMRANNTKTAKNSLDKLLAISTSSAREKNLNLWLQQLILDLQLKNNLVDPAVATLNNLYKTNEIDLSALIQTVDHLILTDRFESANELLHKFDIKQSLMIRRAILHSQLTKGRNNNFDVALEQIESYITAQDSSKFREVALWFYFIKDDQLSAVNYAEENIKNHQTEIDKSLLSYVSSVPLKKVGDK